MDNKCQKLVLPHGSIFYVIIRIQVLKATMLGNFDE